MTRILRRCAQWPCLPARLRCVATTIDKQEIDQFQKLTADWWDEFGPTKGLHSMNRVRVPFIRDGLIDEGAVAKQNVGTSTPLKGLSILDVGCGGGILSEALARLGAKVTGIDANPSIVDLARKHAENNCLDINYLFSCVENHSKENPKKYDAVVASEIIEHVTEKDKLIAGCAECLKPSGQMFVTTINKTFLANFLGILVAEDLMGLVPKGTHRFDKFIESHKLQRMLEDNYDGNVVCAVYIMTHNHGLHTKLVHGMFYNVVTNNWSWCSDTSINYCIRAVKIEPTSVL